MGDFEIKKILRKFSLNSYDKDERKDICDWLSDEKNETSVKEALLEDLRNYQLDNSSSVKVDFTRIHDSIEEKIFGTKKTSENYIFDWKNKNVGYFLKIAALFILLLAGGGILSYVVFHPSQKVIVTYNEIKAPLGSKSEIILPDGSKVWLNAGSIIKYQNLFNKSNRDILLEGEAYFKVAKNKHIPFVVKTGDLNIVAVGTEFNVKAYKDEGIIETTLVEGRVTIRNNLRIKNYRDRMVFLNPRQMAVYVKDQQELRVEDINSIKQSSPKVLQPKKGVMYISTKVDPLPIISWKEDKLVFKGEELSNLAIKLGRKYNVSFLFESEKIKRFRFTGTLEDETLTQVLDVIKLTAPIDYRLEGKEVKIVENSTMMKKFSSHLKKK